MTALAILTEARDQGIKVTVDGDKLILEGDITPEMVATFKANKPAIMKVLAAVPIAEKNPTAAPVPEAANVGMGVLCDDCGRPTRFALVTDYGARYCRECVFPSEQRQRKGGNRG